MNLSHQIWVQAGTMASPCTMVSSVKIFGLRVCFGVRNDAKMLPSSLICFPNVERLHAEVNPFLILAQIGIIYYMLVLYQSEADVLHRFEQLNYNPKKLMNPLASST